MCKLPIMFEIMKAKNIKLVDLAKAIGASQGNISDWKSGKSTPSAEKLVAIAEYLGVTPEYLLTGENKNKPAPKFEDELTAEELDLVKWFRGSSKTMREIAIEILKRQV